MLRIVENPYMKFMDIESGAFIALGFFEDKLYCVMLKDESVITLYRKDEKKVKFKNKERKMEVLLRIPLEGYEIKEFEDTGTMLIARKGLSGRPDYSLEGKGFVIEFKNGLVYVIDIYDPKVAKVFRERLLLDCA